MIEVTDGFWVVSIDRRTGDATAELVIEKDDAYQRAIDIQKAHRSISTTVVRRLSMRERNR